MSSTNLKIQLEKLIELQALDGEIYKLNDEKNAIPQQIDNLIKEFEEKKKQLAAIEKEYLNVQKEKKDAELELASKEESIKKLQTQLYSLKTNKEYNAMLVQIQDAKADASLIEDKILESMEKIEQVKSRIDAEKKHLEEEEKKLNAQKQVLIARQKEIEANISLLQSKRNQITPYLEKSILSQYERILRSREGLAIVSVKNNSCSGCNMFVPAQMINLIKMYERLVTCEVCNRILFVTDEST
ncbi:MAG: C4-type zinc ribbon domain-containing protein [Candidatus Omnitrophica bacterium]|nr:C4-type zinc ribbon domain-containing protein [Candidatus Omnitrophota bacterium]